MHILLSNDDGLFAPGLHALYDVLVDEGGRLGGPLGGDGDDRGVFVVAPLTMQSATSHGVTFHEPLMVRQEKVSPRLSGISVDGRPADCVKLALSTLWPERFGADTLPELLISGMNAGANCGLYVVYSGTVAAALEGAFLGIPSISVSLHIGEQRPRFDVAARHARRVIEEILLHGLNAHECLSINLPVTEEEGPLPPVRVCPMNLHGSVDHYEKRVSPAGDVYYWPAQNHFAFHGTDTGSDVELLFQRFITVTPLRYDLTQHHQIQTWQKKLESLRRGAEGTS